MTTSAHALAKAKLHTLAMRAAARAGISAQAQGLLAVLIAEAWPDGPRWTARLGMELLAERLSCTRNTLRSWTRELERAQLVRRRIGKAGSVTRWTLPKRFDEGAAGAPHRVSQRDGADAPARHSRGSLGRMDSDSKCETPGDSPSLANGERAARGPGERASPQPRNAVPRISPPLLAVARSSDGLARESVRRAAAFGDSAALELLRELGEIVDVRA